MKKFVIERNIPEIGSKARDDFRAAATKSNEVLAQLSPNIHWVQSYVTGDKIFCVYLAADEEMIREHARLSGFPANAIPEVRRLIDPTTAAAGCDGDTLGAGAGCLHPLSCSPSLRRSSPSRQSPRRSR